MAKLWSSAKCAEVQGSWSTPSGRRRGSRSTRVTTPGWRRGVGRPCEKSGKDVSQYPMDATEEVSPSIEYARCPVCHGTPEKRERRGLVIASCSHCGGWGFCGTVLDPAERMQVV